MIFLAVRNLISEKTRFAFSAAGIGFAVFLITVLLGLYQGWSVKVGGFVADVDADGWVARDGTTDFINAASILPNSLGDDLRARPEIESAHPLVVRPMRFFHNGEKFETHLVGYDVASGVGGPTRVTKGRGDPQANEIVIDEVLSRVHGVGVGDTLRSGATTIHVVGVSSGGNLAFSQVSFMNTESAQQLLQIGDLVTFWLVKLKDPGGIAAFSAALPETNDGVTVFSTAQFASETRHRILDNVLPILGLIVALAFLVGIAITSLTIYTATIERTREFGIMKAVGFNNRDLYQLVLIQSCVTAALGFVFGVTLTLIVSRFIDRLVVQFILFIRPTDILLVLLATIIMAAAAAFVPARRVGAIDPAVAFKG